MSKIVVAMMTPKQLISFLQGMGGTLPTLETAPTKVGSGVGMGRDPKVENVEQYRRPVGDSEGRQGRPTRLTVKGMKVVWALYREGFSVPEISRAFAPIINREAVRRLVNKISKAGK